MEILDLGEQPLANALLDSPDTPECLYPLKLVWDQASGLVRVEPEVRPEILFTNYPYCSSTSSTLLANARELAIRYVREFGLRSSSCVVELACNDGYWLQYFRQMGIGCYGVDPAENIVEMAKGKGIDVVCDYFSEKLAAELESTKGPADLVLANNVLAHVPDPNDFLRGISRLLKTGAVAVIEVPYLRDLIDKGEYDTIYHEHRYYFSLCGFESVLRGSGLDLWKVERIPVHGGSLRLFLCRKGEREADGSVGLLAGEENGEGMQTSAYYQGFRKRVEEHAKKFEDIILRAGKIGLRVAAYGASAKGAVLLNYTGLGASNIEYIVDRNPLKAGKYSPGRKLKIVGCDELDRNPPDLLVLLAWNFAEEIAAELLPLLNAGLVLLKPLPEPVFWSAAGEPAWLRTLSGVGTLQTTTAIPGVSEFRPDAGCAPGSAP